ncbi:uncharacterized protein LOC121398242 [Xenopus laevis]|uniref:Uncharacterized protein LOC121398242 n=1 Tax=Xenopus laevis TaxID=8355 RepID=A0A8J1LWH9_XENLA|nr:uncharacterized protein LOC121398242 [Xenopus laevis]
MKRAKASSRQIVGISSRCQQDQFQWMIDMLTSHLSELVTEVKYYPITNENSDEWKKEVKGCSFGILYHSLKHGRINITDVEGSLYDKELLYMSQCLDKENVMVVLDDLEQTTEEETKRILRTQPSIKHCSSLLLLTAKKDKENYFLFQIDAISPLLNTVKSRSSSAFAIKNTSSTEARSLCDGDSTETHVNRRGPGTTRVNRRGPGTTPASISAPVAISLGADAAPINNQVVEMLTRVLSSVEQITTKISNQTEQLEEFKKEHQANISRLNQQFEIFKKEVIQQLQGLL